MDLHRRRQGSPARAARNTVIEPHRAKALGPERFHGLGCKHAVWSTAIGDNLFSARQLREAYSQFLQWHGHRADNVRGAVFFLRQTSEKAARQNPFESNSYGCFAILGRTSAGDISGHLNSPLHSHLTLGISTPESRSVRTCPLTSSRCSAASTCRATRRTRRTTAARIWFNEVPADRYESHPSHEPMSLYRMSRRARSLRAVCLVESSSCRYGAILGRTSAEDICGHLS